MLSILSNSTAVAPSLTLPFSASGGTPPYSWSVIAGGAGGTINSSGLYTSPIVLGTDIVKVTDVNSLSAQVPVMIGNTLLLFCDIIQQGMGLANGQVYVWDQKINIPPDERLYVAVSVLSTKPFGNSNVFNSDGTQYQATNIAAQLSLDIFSRGPAARDQKELVVLALNSQYAEQQMELNSFRIYQITNSFVNLSEIDGAAIPYRFNIGVTIQYFISQTSSVGYYNSIPYPTVVPNP